MRAPRNEEGLPCNLNLCPALQVRANTSHPVFADLLQVIDAALDSDVSSSKAAFVNRTQQCFAVKSGVDSFLDLARTSFCRISEEIHELAAKYRGTHGIESLKAGPSCPPLSSVIVFERPAVPSFKLEQLTYNACR